MILEGITLHLKDSWLSSISKDFPQKELEVVGFQAVNDTQWRGILQTDVDEDIPKLLEWMKAHGDVENLVLLKCEKTDCSQECAKSSQCSIAFMCNPPLFSQSLTKNSVFFQGPILLQNGTVYLRVASTNEGLKQFYFDLLDLYGCEVHIIKKFKQDELEKASLTEKQERCLRTAIDLGYYAVPRKITVQELASRLDIAQSTLGEHLRKAEEVIITSYAV